MGLWMLLEMVMYSTIHLRTTKEYSNMMTAQKPISKWVQRVWYVKFLILL